MTTNSKYFKISTFIGCLALALVLTGCTHKDDTTTITIDEPVNNQQTVTTTQPSSTPSKAPSTNSQSATTTGSQQVTIPKSVLLEADFAQQAPFGNWDEVHQETCEEASMIIADRYFDQQSLNETIMESELQALLKWQTQHDYKIDTTAHETVDILQTYFNREAHVSTKVTTDAIKYELAQGHLVIIPAAGRLLGNPNFTGAGPIYHMLVVVGYDDDEFITHDVGTRKGKNYHYKYNTLINAVHNWNHDRAEGGMTDAEMAMGEKVIVVVTK
ncbi:MAG: C39 family peptidase [Candidatus Buchananbacteria bacterium]|nr:C39 family peptidase [Candidatus Buchananbacteria bacterium]